MDNNEIPKYRKKKPSKSKSASKSDHKHQYYDLQTIPKDFTIIDIGCYQALHGVIYSEWAYKSLIERKFYWKGATNDNRKIKYRI